MTKDESNCPFCDLDPSRVVAQSELAVALRDGYPVSEGHTLIVPRRHVSDWFDATDEERTEIFKLVDECKQSLDPERAPDGYNIGMNIGIAAGQTVMHLHVHLIPRYEGDVDDPTGGVRLVVPEKGNYRRPGFIPKLKTTS